MELAKQIKKYRTEFALSQDDLAEKLYVSRRTVSNWENEKSCPDIKSVVLMSYIFNVSVDEFLKGNYKEVSELVFKEDRESFEKNTAIMAVLTFVCLLSLWPLVHFFDKLGIALWGAIYMVLMYFSRKVETYKKKFGIHTYKEIDAFYKGRKLSEAEKNQEYGKRIYQRILMGFAGATVMIAVTYFFALLLGDI